jgi:hypothetical protein
VGVGEVEVVEVEEEEGGEERGDVFGEGGFAG